MPWEALFDAYSLKNSRGWAYESTLCALSGTLRCSTILKYLGMNSLEDIGGVAPPPEYTNSGVYRSSAAGGSAKGPSSCLTVAWSSPEMSTWHFFREIYHHIRMTQMGCFVLREAFRGMLRTKGGVFCAEEGILRDAQNKKWGVLCWRGCSEAALSTYWGIFVLRSSNSGIIMGNKKAHSGEELTIFC